jgi:hypothetical protein
MSPWVSCGHLQAPWPPIKGAPPSCPGRAAVEPPSAPLLAAAASSRPGRLGTRPSPSPPSLAPTKTHRRAAPPAELPTAPDQPLQRRPPPATAAHSTAGHLYSQIQTKPVPSHLSTLPPPFPGQARRRAAPATAPRGYIATPKLFRGSSLQKGNSNSKSDFLVSCKLRITS